MQTIPDTTSAVGSRQSVSFYDVVEEVIADAGWMYFIKSVHESRIHMLVPEARVLSTSRSLSDGCMMETRLFPVQQLLAAQKEKTTALKRKTDEVGKVFWKVFIKTPTNFLQAVMVSLPQTSVTVT